MFELRDVVRIARTPEEVFDFAADPANLPRWQSAAISGQWVSGEGAVGAVYKQEGRFLGRRMVSVFEITRWEPAKEWAVRLKQGPVPFGYIASLKRIDDESELTFDVRFEFRGFFKILEPLAKQRLSSMIRQDNQRLKAVLEAK